MHHTITRSHPAHKVTPKHLTSPGHGSVFISSAPAIVIADGNALLLNGGMNDKSDLLAQIDELHRELAAEKAENAALKVPTKINASIWTENNL